MSTSETQTAPGAPDSPCPNCGHPVEDRFCSHCGQKRIEGRLTVRGTVADLNESLGWERGFLHTVRELWLRPGPTIRAYVAGRRKVFTSPFKYLAIWTAVVAILLSFIDLDDYAPPEEILTPAQVEEAGLPPELPVWMRDFNRLLRRYVNVAYLLALPFLAGITKLLFLRKGYTYAEHVVFHAYVLAQVSMFLIVWVLVGLPWLSTETYLYWLVGQMAAGFVYFTWALIGFFEVGMVSGIVRSVLASLGNFVVTQLLIVVFFVLYLIYRVFE